MNIKEKIEDRLNVLAIQIEKNIAENEKLISSIPNKNNTKLFNIDAAFMIKQMVSTEFLFIELGRILGDLSNCKENTQKIYKELSENMEKLQTIKGSENLPDELKEYLNKVNG